MSMLRPAEDACLLIADISGYTSYLTATELEHAHDVIADLVDTVIRTLEPTFDVIETEGDAVFAVAPLDGLSGQMVLDVVDACYFTFRRHSRSVVRATTCECNACRNIPSLDLKFVVHSGAVVRARMGRSENVTGPAVIVVHRLLKNSVHERFGPNAYLLATLEAVRSLGLDHEGLRCQRCVESYEHLGDVPALVIDMEERWQEAERSAELHVSREQAGLVIERTLDAPPPVAWEHLLDPRKRMLWQTMLTGIDEETKGARRQQGTIVHCAHGAGTITEELIEWRPFERFTWDVEIPGYGPMRNTIVLQPRGDGTLLEDLMDGPRSDEQAAAWPQVKAFIEEQASIGYDNLVALLRSP
jgi:uncharacterized protein YndB with AHSA1/START domain